MSRMQSMATLFAVTATLFLSLIAVAPALGATTDTVGIGVSQLGA